MARPFLRDSEKRKMVSIRLAPNEIEELKSISPKRSITDAIKIFLTALREGKKDELSKTKRKSSNDQIRKS